MRSRHLVSIRAAFLEALLAVSAVAASAQPAAETLVLFDPTVPETPECVRFDRFDNAYVTLGLTGEIRRIAPDGSQSTVAFLPIEPPCGGLFPPPSALGLAIDEQNQLYAAAFACNPMASGIWKVEPETGTIELLAQVPSQTALNGIDAYHDGFIYAADTFGALVWRVPKNGGPLEVWSDDPLLVPVAPGPGPNGLRVFRGEVYVAVSANGTIVAIPFEPDGSAGPARIHATLPAGQGCDDFAIDVHGSIYCTTDPSNVLVRLDPDGTTEVLLTAADGLDGPTSATFGRRGPNRKNLYVTNGAFPFFPGPDPRRPSLMRLRLDLPGAPE